MNPSNPDNANPQVALHAGVSRRSFKGVSVPDGYVVGLGRDYPYPKTAHLYKGTFADPGRPMCKRGFNRGDGYSIWRNPMADYGICAVCLRRAVQGKDSLPWPETTTNRGAERRRPMTPDSPQASAPSFPAAGSARLSKKQRDLLETVAALPQYMPGRPASLYWGNIPEHIWFTFRSENTVRTWMGNLVFRGFLRVENDFFYYITDEGRAAIGQNEPRSAVAPGERASE